MDIVKVFGDNLKLYRTQLGLSQEAFASKCGMHRTYISAIAEVFLWRTYSALQMHWASKHTNYLLRRLQDDYDA